MTQLDNLGDATGATLIAESQSQKATTSNTVDNVLSNATQKVFDITITGDRTLTDDEFFLNRIFNLSGTPAGDFSLFTPASGEHDFTVINGTNKICTVDATGGAGTTVALRESLAGSFHSDGIDILVGIDPDIMRYSTFAVDGAADYFIGWDASLGVLGRVLGDNLPGSGGSLGSGAFPFSGALAKLSADETGANYSSSSAIPFDGTDEYDVGDWHDPVTLNSRLTVPAGVTRVKVVGNVWIGDLTENKFAQIDIRKGGAVDYPGIGTLRVEATVADQFLHVSTGVLSVVAGNYFELFLRVEDDTSITVQNERTSFSIMAVETSESGKTATLQTAGDTQTVIANAAMASDSAHTIRAYGQGREDATGDTYHFEIFGGARNEGGTSTAPTPNVIEVTDAGASTWDATLEANDASDEWEILVTGEAAHTIDWTVTYFEIVQ